MVVVLRARSECRNPSCRPADAEEVPPDTGRKMARSVVLRHSRLSSFAGCYAAFLFGVGWIFDAGLGCVHIHPKHAQQSVVRWLFFAQKPLVQTAAHGHRSTGARSFFFLPSCRVACAAPFIWLHRSVSSVLCPLPQTKRKKINSKNNTHIAYVYVAPDEHPRRLPQWPLPPHSSTRPARFALRRSIKPVLGRCSRRPDLVTSNAWCMVTRLRF